MQQKSYPDKLSSSRFRHRPATRRRQPGQGVECRTTGGGPTAVHPKLMAAVVMAALMVLPSVAFGQGEASTDQPGVVADIDQIEEEIGDGEPDDDEIAQAEQEGNVITPEDLSPHERYDLPPNFDPGFRPRQIPRNTRVTIDFRDADLEEVVKFFSGVMSINFIVADSLAADRSITIISPEEVTVEEAYRAFLSALEMNGLTIVPHGRFLKILEADQAISEPLVPYDVHDDIPAESRMVTGIIPVENADIDEIEEVIGHFTSDHANIIKYHSSLIITENAANLRRLRAMIQRLDEGESVSNHYVYQVRYADATEIEEQLRQIFEDDDDDASEAQTARERRRQRRRQDEEPTEADVDQLDVRIDKIVADERTNQLIIVANEQSFERVREMIDILDVETAVGGEVHVKFLEYANADELASTMSELETGSRRGGDEEGGVASLLQGEVQITAHEPNNALVVVASPRDFMSLESVINELDRPQRQVYVEAVIMEVGMDVNRRLDLGMTSGFGADMGGVIPDSVIEDGRVNDTTGVAFGGSHFDLKEFDFAQGLGLGLLGPAIQLPGTELSLPAVALLLQATQTDDSVNVLSTPSILTMDNEEAEIMIGERVPIPQGIGPGGGGGGLGSLLGLGGLTSGFDQFQQGQQVAGDAATTTNANNLGNLGALGGMSGLGGLLGGGLTTPVTYEDVGIELRILPQINESDYVRLEVDQEVSDLAGADPLPTRTRRNVQSTVLVRDQSTIVIGGLMRDQERETVEKVPFLGDIPVLGVLFRNRSVTTQKQNLILMLTPYIIESERDMQAIYDRKMEERREVMELFARRDREYHRHVDYRKKTGLLDRMRAEIGDAQREERAREEALEQFEEHGPRYRILGGDHSRPQQQQQPNQAPIEDADPVNDDIQLEVDDDQDDEPVEDPEVTDEADEADEPDDEQQDEE